MADIFVSYTSADREWAYWIAKELEALGHAPRVHEWEIERGADIYAWMVGSSRVDLQACKLEYSIVSPK